MLIGEPGDDLRETARATYNVHKENITDMEKLKRPAHVAEEKL